MVMASESAVVSVQPHESFFGAILFSCFVWWFCGGVFGIIGFILAGASITIFTSGVPRGGGVRGAAAPQTRDTKFVNVFKMFESLFLVYITPLYSYLLVILHFMYAVSM